MTFIIIGIIGLVTVLLTIIIEMSERQRRKLHKAQREELKSKFSIGDEVEYLGTTFKVVNYQGVRPSAITGFEFYTCLVCDYFNIRGELRTKEFSMRDVDFLTNKTKRKEIS